MEFARRGRPATAGAGVDDDGRRSPDPMLPHGDSMLVIRDALLSQLQKDRLRQEIILAKLGKIECALALRSADADSDFSDPMIDTSQDFEEILEDFEEVGGDLTENITDPVFDAEPEKDSDFSDPTIDTSQDFEESLEEFEEVGGNLTDNITDPVFDAEPEKGDSMLVIRDALLSQLQKDRLRQEIILAELGKIECALALRSADAGQENAAPDECNVQESSETMLPKKTLPSSVKWACSICQVKATSQGNLWQHFAGQKHWSKVLSLVSKYNAKCQKAKETADKSGNALPMWVCRFCQANCTCESDLENHMKGKRHQTNVRALLEECKNMESNYASPEVKSGLNSVQQDEEGPAPTWTCSLCQARCTRQSELENHLRGKRHRLNFLLLQVEEAKLYLSLCFCKLCNLQCNSKNTLAEHCKGKRHSHKVEKLMSLSFCEVCNLQCNSEKMLAHHRTGKKHLAKLNGC